MWNLVPQPGIATSSPALQGRFLITAPSGKSLAGLFVWFFTLEIWSLDLEKDCLLQGQSSCFGFQLLNLQLICPAFFLFLRCLGLRFNLFPSILTCFFFFWPHCMTCRILSPWPGTEPTAAVQAPSPNHWTARELPRVGTHFHELF